MKRNEDIDPKILDAIAKSSPEQVVNKKIIVLDDSEDILILVKRFLNEFKGITILTFKDEFKAIEAINKERPDLIICDVFLESLDGVKVGKFLKEIEVYSGNILFISSYSRGELERKFGLSSDAEFLQKPLDKNILTKSIERLLNE